ncbi:MAG: C40 family peptidase [Defluviitaleaceae bacterium]|nr:C40 family peptidase [Defluviitaleaceae bacterium]
MCRTLLISFLLTILFSVTAYANGTYAIVTGSRVNVRSCASIGADNRLFQVEHGTVIEIHGVSGDFFRASIQGTDDVYISRDFVRITQTSGTVTAAPFTLVSGLPHEVAFSFIPNGETVTVKYVYEDLYGIEFNDEIAFVAQTDVEIPCFAVNLPTARVGSALAYEIIETAKNYIGTRYLHGGATPNGFDCSGFIIYLFTPHGIDLNRSSGGQARNGIAITRDEIEPGDLIFFGYGNHINHVGLYIGNNQFIHSSSHATNGVIICDLDDVHNSRGFITARRVII